MEGTPEPQESQPPGTEMVTINAGVTIDLGLGELISRVVGPPLEQVGGILADVLGWWRLELSIPLWRRARRRLEGAGFEVAQAGPVDLSTLFPILQWGSIATDESMHERWTSLLANLLVDPQAVPPSFPEILRQLEPREARALDRLYDKTGGPPAARAEVSGLSLEDLGGEIAAANLDNIVRLGLAFHPSESPAMRSGVAVPRDRVAITAQGAAFIAACRGPEPPSG